MDIIDKRRQLRPILIFFGVFVLIGFGLIASYTAPLKAVTTAILWMFACIMSGGAIGFLFGIPKTFQDGTPPTDSKHESNGDYRLRVNTNLTEISDWLTKIIVGLGLVNLTKLPPYIHGTALVLAQGINTTQKSSALAFAYGLITCYTILGFLFGYLFTRLVLSKEFSIADQDSISQLQNKFDSTQIQFANIEAKQGLFTQSLYPENLNTTEKTLREDDNGGLNENMKQLVEMANDYLNISAPDWAERTRLKDIGANNMGNYALTNKIPKQLIFDDIKSNPVNEGMVLALATLINIRPEISDLDMLLNIGKNLSRLHVKYRILLAIVTLNKKGYISAEEKTLVLALVNSYKQQADQSLLDMIDSTLSLLKN